jgi:lipopolysaccharide transport system ATP-binding protein
MGDTVLKVENLSKIYRLGEVGTGTISHDLNRIWAKVRGKEDPYAVVGQINDRSSKAKSDYVYALKDINFEVKQGEILGIIGKNGAGKSTLLKLISKITAPSTGSIKAKGRIASLLEVGTGMHPEMTARENIYLNGTILGMRKHEITKKFDEIIDFAGCEMYVDTPVKRFSSGMRVRLGFAVAAFLEPEILIVDEVLAVGDAEFQKKAIGKMKEVSTNDGRTVLFVSHNMVSIKALCDRAVLLKNGTVFEDGSVDKIIDSYLSISEKLDKSGIVKRDFGKYQTGVAYVSYFSLLNSNNEQVEQIAYNEPFKINLNIDACEDLKNALIDIRVSKDGIELIHATNLYENVTLNLNKNSELQLEVDLENNFQPGHYSLTVGVHSEDGTTHHFLENFMDFEILNIAREGDGHKYNWLVGYTRPKSEWTIKK